MAPQAALQALEVQGVPTTIPLHLAILRHADFRAGTYDTRWLEAHLDGLLRGDSSSQTSPGPS